MDAQKPSRHGYRYQKAAAPQHPQDDPAQPSGLRFRLFGLAWRIQPLYAQAGRPFGPTDAGLALWVEFGRRTHSN